MMWLTNELKCEEKSLKSIENNILYDIYLFEDGLVVVELRPIARMWDLDLRGKCSP